MKRMIFPISLFALSLCFSTFDAEAQPLRVLQDSPTFSDSLKMEQLPRSSNIKNIQVLSEKSGVAFTNDTLFRTDNNGETWREISLPNRLNEAIGAVYFLNESVGWAILADRKNLSIQLAGTTDGGNSWTKTPITLRSEDLLEADLENLKFEPQTNDSFILTFRAPTSSYFIGQIVYQSSNGGQSWNFLQRTAEIRRDDEASAEKTSENWILKTVGNCEGTKTGCVQQSKIFIGTKEITPLKPNLPNPPSEVTANSRDFYPKCKYSNRKTANCPTNFASARLARRCICRSRDSD